MKDYDQKIPPDTWGSEIIGRYRKNSKGLVEQLLVNRKLTAGDYIIINLLFDIKKTLKSLLKKAKANQNKPA